MKITAEYLHEKWNAFNYYDGGYIQIEVKHALEWHVGYKEIDQKALVIISQNEPELLPSSKSIVVTKGRRTDGRWTLSFVLMRNEQDSVFELLCADLISYSQTADNEISALNLTVRRFKQWNKLLEHQRKSLMDESNRKGLLGELIYLCEVIDAGYPILPAVQGWVGPDGADQDFVYADNWHEVKSVGVSADSVKISSWISYVKPAYSEDAKLSSDAGKQSIAKGIEWYYNGHFLVHPSWKKEWADKYMGDGLKPVGPELPADLPDGDGSLGVLEGHMSGIYHDGKQQYRYWMRDDVQGESSYAFAAAGDLLAKDDYLKVSSNLLDYSFREYRDSVRNNPKSPSYGLLGWAYTHKGTYYGDDNARSILGSLAASAIMNNTSWDKQIVECIVGNFRTTGKNGFRGGNLLDTDLQKKGWREYFDSDLVNLHPHFESWNWACYLWLYTQTKYQPLLDRVKKGVTLMMKGYPNDWNWTNGIQQERARMILPLAWLYRVEPTEQHKQWLEFMTEELLKNQVACGGIREELGNEAKSMFGCTPSNDAYGRTEASLIFKNGDPVADMLYTTNFAFVGLYEVAMATQNPVYLKAVNRMRDFLVRIQVRSDKFKNVDGAWFRAFNYQDWNYWASNADAGWGVWSTLTGWIQSWIIGTQYLMEKNTSLWDLAAKKDVSAIAGSVIEEMITNNKY